MVSNWTLGVALWLLFIAYLCYALCTIGIGAYNAHKRYKEGTKTVAKSNKTIPHPQWVGQTCTVNAVRHQDNFGSTLWIHILVAPVIGIVVGIILVSIGSFCSWVSDLGRNPAEGFFTGLFSLILCLAVLVGIIIALLLPGRLYSLVSTRSIVREYVYCLWASFAVSFAVILLQVR